MNSVAAQRSGLPRRLCLIALAGFAALTVLAGAERSADASLRLSAPAKVKAPGKVRYAVTAASRSGVVTFLVDGKKRWRAKAIDRRLKRRGYIATIGLAPGRHVLTAKISRHGRRVSTRRSVRVVQLPSHRGPEGSRPQRPPKGKPAPAPQPDSETEPTPQPQPEPEPRPAPVLEEEAPSSGQALFRSGFDGSFMGWYVQCPETRASIESASSFMGTSNARFAVHQGDVEPDTGSSRCEVSGPTFHEGQDLYVHDAIRVPSASTYSGSWQIIQQLHEHDWGDSPGIAVFLSGSRALTLGAGDGSPTYWEGPQLAADRWYSLTYRVLLSRDPDNGFVEVWLDGFPQTLTDGGTRAYGQTIQTSRTYLKAGIYRSKSSSGTSLVEHDEIAVGTSLAAVQ